MGLTFSREGLDNPPQTKKLYDRWTSPLTANPFAGGEGLDFHRSPSGASRTVLGMWGISATEIHEKGLDTLMSMDNEKANIGKYQLQLNGGGVIKTMPIAYMSFTPKGPSGNLDGISLSLEGVDDLSAVKNPSNLIVFTILEVASPTPKEDTTPAVSSSSAPESAAGVAGGSSPSPHKQTDFDKALDLYKSNYVQFLSTGNNAYKTAYQNAQEAIDKEILARQKEVEDQKRDMNRFTESYQEGNSELSDIYDSATGLFQNAQQIEDTYQAAKGRYTQAASPESGGPVLNISNGYAFLLRFGLVLILLPLLFFIGYWSPQIKAAATTAVAAVGNMASPVLGATAATAAPSAMSSPVLGPMRA